MSNTEIGTQVRWLDDGTLGLAIKESDGTWTVFTRNPVTGGMREDMGAILGMHIEMVKNHSLSWDCVCSTCNEARRFLGRMWK